MCTDYYHQKELRIAIIAARPSEVSRSCCFRFPLGAQYGTALGVFASQRSAVLTTGSNAQIAIIRALEGRESGYRHGNDNECWGVNGEGEEKEREQKEKN